MISTLAYGFLLGIMVIVGWGINITIVEYFIETEELVEKSIGHKVLTLLSIVPYLVLVLSAILGLFLLIFGVISDIVIYIFKVFINS